jgi:hypothetical protein
MLSARCQEVYIKCLVSDSQTSKVNTYVLLKNLVAKATTSEDDSVLGGVDKKSKLFGGAWKGAGHGSDEDNT